MYVLWFPGDTVISSIAVLTVILRSLGGRATTRPERRLIKFPVHLGWDIPAGLRWTGSQRKEIPVPLIFHASGLAAVLISASAV